MDKYYFAIGSYTDKGKGVSLIAIDKEAENIIEYGNFPSIENPTYLCYSKETSNLFSCSESDNHNSKIYQLSIENSIIYQKNSSEKSNDGFCHLTTYKDRIFGTSYSKGSLFEYINQNSQIKILKNIYYSGIQSRAHQAVVNPDETKLYVCDLGNDKLWIHNLNNISEYTAFNIQEGYGPRHLLFDPYSRYLFLLCELKPYILVISLDKNGSPKEIIQRIETHIQNINIQCSPAAIKIHPSGKTLTISNRFMNTISTYIIERDTTRTELKFHSSIDCGGDKPRDITFSPNGEFLVIANQDSDNISTMKFHPLSGLPEGSFGSELKTGSPVCIVNLN